MALTTIPSELSSVSGISDSSTSTAITIDSSQNVSFAGTITATAATQAASDNSTKLATTAYVTTALANLVDSAPGTLNTLNELAAALGDDANFSTTVTNSIAGKVALSGSGQTIADSGNFTIDAAGDIHLDADSEAIRIRHDGGDIGIIQMTSNDLILRSMVSDKDLIFKGNDGGSVITALTLDMSAAGLAVFNAGATFGGIGELRNIANDLAIFSTTSGHNGLRFHLNGILPTDNAGAIVDNDADLGDPSYRFKDLYLSGSIVNSSDITLDVAGNIILDADSGDVKFKDGGTETLRYSSSGSGPQFFSPVADKDIIFKGSDGGSTITALTLDMSEAGKAIFSGRIQPNEHIIFGSTTGYLQFPAASSRAWVIASHGGTAAPGTSSATFGFHHWSGSAWSNPVNISASGKVGIGTDNPLGHLHVKDGASGMGSVNANFDKLVLEDSSHSGMTILGGANTHGAIYFGDPDVNDVGQIKYQHNDDTLRFTTASVERFLICSPTAGGIFTNSYGGTSSNTVYGQNAYRNAANGGIRNVVIGNSAWYYGTVGDENVIVGTFAAGDNTGNHHGLTGSIYIGQEAGHIGAANFTTAIGYQAGHRAYGSENTFVGHRAGYSASGGTVSGSGNTAVGYHALYSHQTSAQNTTIGVNAGSQITSGHSNILVGYDAGDIITTGYGNVVLGRNSNPNGVNGEYQIVLGHDVSGNGDNKISMGRAAATGYIWNSYTVNANWTHVSDERAKKNITNETLGLSFINRLRPVTFNWKTPSEFSEEYKEAIGSDGTEDPRPDITVHGMIAQEVKAAMDAESNTTFNGWEQDEKGVQALSIEGFVTPLIKAVQELSAEVTALKAEVAALKGE